MTRVVFYLLCFVWKNTQHLWCYGVCRVQKKWRAPLFPGDIQRLRRLFEDAAASCDRGFVSNDLYFIRNFSVWTFLLDFRCVCFSGAIYVNHTWVEHTSLLYSTHRTYNTRLCNTQRCVRVLLLSINSLGLLHLIDNDKKSYRSCRITLLFDRLYVRGPTNKTLRWSRTIKLIYDLRSMSRLFFLVIRRSFYSAGLRDELLMPVAKQSGEPYWFCRSNE